MEKMYQNQNLLRWYQYTVIQSTVNSYQKASKVLFTFVPNKQFGQLITISPQSLTMLRTTRAEIQSVELWFTDQDNRPLEIEYSLDITLILGRDYKNEILSRTKIQKIR